MSSQSKEIFCQLKRYINNNIKTISTSNICINGKIWTKTLVFNSITGEYLKTIWNDELGNQVAAPDSSLINNSLCQNSGSSENEIPLQIQNPFGVLLNTVEKLPNI